MKRAALLTVVAFACLAAEAASPFVISRNRRPLVVLPPNPSPSLSYAADEFVRIIQLMTGIRLPQGTKPSGAAVRLVQDKGLGDGFSLACDGRTLTVTGGPRGILYGVYEVLETYGGVGWYASWHEVVPKRDRLEVPAGLARSEKPAFEMREAMWYDLRNADFAARLRLNSSYHAPTEKHGGTARYFGNGMAHSMPFLLPASEFFTAHPEYFALDRASNRRSRDGHCLTNPDVLRIVVERLKELIRNHSDCPAFTVSQANDVVFCGCPACAEVVRGGKPRSTHFVTFVNAVAAAIAREFPKVLVQTLAYQPTRTPPKDLSLAPNVLPCFCSMEADKSRPFATSPTRSSIKTCEDLAIWSKAARQLMAWNYTSYFERYLFPYPNVLPFAEDLRLFRDHHVSWMVEQGAYQGRHAAFAELKGWLQAKLMWNPDQPLEPLLDRFFAGYYGKAAPFARRYFDELHAERLAWAKDIPERGLHFIDPIDTPALSNEFLLRAEGLWRDAEAAVAKEPAVYGYNVRMSALPPTYALYLRERRLFDLAGTSAEAADAIAAKTARARLLRARIEEAGDIRIGEFVENTCFTNEVTALAAADPKKSVVSRTAFRTGPAAFAGEGTYAELVRDAKSDWSLAWRVPYDPATPGKRFISLVGERIVAEPGARYALHAHVRVDFRKSRVATKEPALTAEFVRRADSEKKAQGISVATVTIGDNPNAPICWSTVKAGSCRRTWQWIDLDLPLFSPDEIEVFTLGIAIPDGGGEPAVSTLYIDSLEFVRK